MTPSHPLLEIKQLRYFTAVAEELNIGRAAKRLHITQPPLTRQIHQLEEQLGVTLFIRTPRGVELTQAGETLLTEARRLLSLAENAAERARMAERGELGRMDIGYYGSPIFAVIPRLLSRFHALYPNVEIALHNVSKSEQVNALLDGRLRIGFCRAFTPEPGLGVEEVMHEPLYVALWAKHKLAAHPEVAVKDLREEDMILFPSASRPSFADEVVAVCNQAGFQPNVSQETEDAVSCIALVGTGFGTALVPESALNLRFPDVVYKPIAGETPYTTLSCAYRQNDQSPILRAFLEVLKEFYRNAGANKGRR